MVYYSEQERKQIPSIDEMIKYEKHYLRSRKEELEKMQEQKAPLIIIFNQHRMIQDSEFLIRVLSGERRFAEKFLSQ